MFRPELESGTVLQQMRIAIASSSERPTTNCQRRSATSFCTATGDAANNEFQCRTRGTTATVIDDDDDFLGLCRTRFGHAWPFEFHPSGDHCLDGYIVCQITRSDALNGCQPCLVGQHHRDGHRHVDVRGFDDVVAADDDVTIHHQTDSQDDLKIEPPKAQAGE